MNRLMWLAALSLFASSCSLRYDFTECKSTADCTPLAAEGELLACVNNECVPTQECQTNADCKDADRPICTANACVADTTMGDMGNDTSVTPDMDNTPDMSEDMPVDMAPACADNTECAEGQLCIEGGCVEIASEDCQQVVIGTEARSPKTVVLGAVLSISPPYTNIGPPLEKSIRLAVKEFNNAGGLPDGSRIVLVSCDDAGNSAKAQRGATHLADVLKSPAIIGPLLSTPYIDVVTNVTRPKGVFTITPTASAPEITALLDDGLSWRTFPSDVIQANAVAGRLQELQAISSRRVTVFYKDDAYGNGLFNQLSPKIPAIVGNNSVQFIKYADPATFGFDTAQIQMEFGRVIGQAAVSPGNLLIVIGTSEAISLALAYYQNVTPTTTIFTHGAAADLTTIPATNEALQPLVRALGPNIFHPTNYPTYLTRFNVEYPNEPPITISTLAYDATVVALLGMSGVPSGEAVTGAGIAAAMAKIVDKDGTVVSYDDPTFFTNGRNVLASGGTIDYVGVSGENDFDLATGDVRSDFLTFTTYKDANNTWQIIPERAYLLAPAPLFVGRWFTLCSAQSPSPGMCPSQTQACIPANASTSLCLETCATADPMCPTGLTCTPLPNPPGAGVCAPPQP
ncbi:MAG: ABC transporter substrate-binding protein [bacterium]